MREVQTRDVILELVKHAAGCQRTCSLSQSYRPDAKTWRFTHNTVRASEATDVDPHFLVTVGADAAEDLLAFWCREMHAGRPPGPHGYEMPVERDGRTEIAYIPVACDG